MTHHKKRRKSGRRRRRNPGGMWMDILTAIGVGGVAALTGAVFLPKLLPAQVVQSNWWKAAVLVGLGAGTGYILWKLDKKEAAVAATAVFAGGGITVGVLQLMASSQTAPAATAPQVQAPAALAPGAIGNTWDIGRTWDTGAVSIGGVVVDDMNAVSLGATWDIDAVSLGAVEMQMEDAAY